MLGVGLALSVAVVVAEAGRSRLRCYVAYITLGMLPPAQIDLQDVNAVLLSEQGGRDVRVLFQPEVVSFRVEPQVGRDEKAIVSLKVTLKTREAAHEDSVGRFLSGLVLQKSYLRVRLEEARRLHASRIAALDSVIRLSKIRVDREVVGGISSAKRTVGADKERGAEVSAVAELGGFLQQRALLESKLPLLDESNLTFDVREQYAQESGFGLRTVLLLLSIWVVLCFVLVLVWGVGYLYRVSAESVKLQREELDNREKGKGE